MDVLDTIYPKRKENPKIIFGRLLWWFERSAHNCKYFILRNKTVIDILFIATYLIEQLVFLYIIFSSRFNYNPRTIAAIFIIVLLSTMALEKSLMELRLLAMSKGVAKISQENLNMRILVKKAFKFVSENFEKNSKKG